MVLLKTLSRRERHTETQLLLLHLTVWAVGFFVFFLAALLNIHIFKIIMKIDGRKSQARSLPPKKLKLK